MEVSSMRDGCVRLLDTRVYQLVELNILNDKQ